MSVLIKGMEMPKHVSVNGEKDTAFLTREEAEQALKERESDA